MRCRIANVASEVTNATGAATNGEVEDYLVTISAGDTEPPTPIPTFDTEPPTPIPTLGDWGRIILIMLFGVIALLQQRRLCRAAVKN